MPSQHASPADLQKIGTQILVLLANYWAADESREVRALIADSWIEDLEDFDPELVAAACRDWRLNENRHKRPMSGDIRQLCIEIQASRTLKLAKPELMPEAEQIEIADNWARNRGFASMAEMQRSPGFTGASIKIGPRLWRRCERMIPLDDVALDDAAE
jgi:hypothetical protein